VTWDTPGDTRQRSLTLTPGCGAPFGQALARPAPWAPVRSAASTRRRAGRRSRRGVRCRRAGPGGRAADCARATPPRPPAPSPHAPCRARASAPRCRRGGRGGAGRAPRRVLDRLRRYQLGNGRTRPAFRLARGVQRPAPRPPGLRSVASPAPARDAASRSAAPGCRALGSATELVDSQVDERCGELGEADAAGAGVASGDARRATRPDRPAGRAMARPCGRCTARLRRSGAAPTNGRPCVRRFLCGWLRSSRSQSSPACDAGAPVRPPCALWSAITGGPLLSGPVDA